jgi:hypothetical protein
VDGNDVFMDALGYGFEKNESSKWGQGMVCLWVFWGITSKKQIKYIY